MLMRVPLAVYPLGYEVPQCNANMRDRQNRVILLQAATH